MIAGEEFRGEAVSIPLSSERALEIGQSLGLIDSANIERMRSPGMTIPARGDGILVPALRTLNDFTPGEIVYLYWGMSEGHFLQRKVQKIWTDTGLLMCVPPDTTVQTNVYSDCPDPKYFGLWKQQDIEHLLAVREQVHGSGHYTAMTYIKIIHEHLDSHTDPHTMKQVFRKLRDLRSLKDL